LVLMMLDLIRVVVQIDKDNHQFMCLFERLMGKRCSCVSSLSDNDDNYRCIKA
jgi:hypothetical protein